MIYILRQLFPSKAHKTALFAIKRLSPQFEDQIAWDLVRDRIVTNLLKYPNSKMAAFRHGQASANKTMLALIAHSAELMVVSGEYHIYRGRLGLSGLSLQLIAFRAINLLKDEGGCTVERADDWIAEIDEQIADAG